MNSLDGFAGQSNTVFGLLLVGVLELIEEMAAACLMYWVVTRHDKCCMKMDFCERIGP